jgi:hypothetical protein
MSHQPNNFERSGKTPEPFAYFILMRHECRAPYALGKAYPVTVSVTRATPEGDLYDGMILGLSCYGNTTARPQPLRCLA